jgi:hypothetical protein
MTELSDRVKDYLSRKKAPKVQTATSTVKVEVDENEIQDFVKEFKEAFKTPIFMFKLICTVIIVLFVMWAISVASIQNDCFKSKKCREWIQKNR